MSSICFVHKDLATVDRGGVCRLLKTIAEGVSKKGWTVFALTNYDLDLEGVTTIKIPLRNNYDDHYQDVVNVINAIKPDIAECSSWRYELLTYIDNEIDRQTKVVVRCDPPASSLFDNVDELAKKEQQLFHKADTRIAISEYARKELASKYGDEEVVLIYNGIKEFPISSLAKIQTISKYEEIDMVNKTSKIVEGRPVKDLLDKTKKNVMWVGKPTRMKGFDFLEKIVETASDEYRFIINTGYSGIECPWKDENYRRALFIRGLDKLEQLALWHGVDISISTSRAEGFGLVVSEALSLGLPVVLNKHCEVFKEFTPNEAVILADAEDSNAFINAMRLSTKKVNYSRNPRSFTQENLVTESIKIYEKLLKE